MRLAILIGLLVTGVAAWLLATWPLINVVETGRTPQYPDLVPRQYRQPLAGVFDAALHAVDRLPRWRLVSYDERAGVIRAESETAWLRFVDDVVIRIEPCESVTCVNVRSASRVGRGDFGQNARNVRAFFDELDRHMEGPRHD